MGVQHLRQWLTRAGRMECWQKVAIGKCIKSLGRSVQESSAPQSGALRSKLLLRRRATSMPTISSGRPDLVAHKVATDNKHNELNHPIYDPDENRHRELTARLRTVCRQMKATDLNTSCEDIAHRSQHARRLKRKRAFVSTRAASTPNRQCEDE
jgi:hypothetical protein